MGRFTKIVVACALAATMLATSGCIIRAEQVAENDSVRPRQDERSVALGTAENARVTLEMGAGELRVEGAQLGGDALSGEFTYAPRNLAPEIEDEVVGDTVEVTVGQPDIRGMRLGLPHLASEWDIGLATDVPTDLDVTLGAGDAELDLSRVALTGLDVTMGAGDLTLDLSGPRTEDLSAKVTAGAGAVEVILPSDVGVRVFGRKDGVGEWVYDGFTVEGDYLVNDAYGTSETTIELDVQRGLGEVRLELAD